MTIKPNGRANGESTHRYFYLVLGFTSKKRPNLWPGTKAGSCLVRLNQKQSSNARGPCAARDSSGIREEKVFLRLSEYLRNFPDEPTRLEDYEEAARFHNICRSAGVAGSPIDFLLCALASHRNVEIFTTDEDFSHYSAHLPVKLYNLRTSKPK